MATAGLGTSSLGFSRALVGSYHSARSTLHSRRRSLHRFAPIDACFARGGDLVLTDNSAGDTTISWAAVATSFHRQTDHHARILSAMARSCAYATRRRQTRYAFGRGDSAGIRSWIRHSDAAFLNWKRKRYAAWKRILASNGTLYDFASPQMGARVEVACRAVLTCSARLRGSSKPWRSRRVHPNAGSISKETVSRSQ